MNLAQKQGISLMLDLIEQQLHGIRVLMSIDEKGATHKVHQTQDAHNPSITTKEEDDEIAKELEISEAEIDERKDQIVQNIFQRAHDYNLDGI